MKPEVTKARKLRREMTYPEVLLWQRLRRKTAGARFRKQHPIGPYIVDFYCAAARLAIEVDGEIHAQPDAISHDETRERFLVENGHKVVHVNGADVLKDADGVAASIGALVARPLHQPSAGPPPRSGEDQV
ncbi:endonuclease domain-containing protein [Sphingomonas sp. M1-B02]|uniref:endonuclease domain-containing protein n=1 Tax=Sphingomonas sp. M1-B02 TaxID=3114300 RepID=UPI00223FAE34|nr:endonuclease domain-containing protein [Sphingomonas sp. S6-11]UZK64968.1 endonuclease domain-containing protein [Sphingomonas sp. S6-11]